MKNYVVFKRVNDIDNYYMTTVKPFHFDAFWPEYALKVTLKQAIKITRQLNAEARLTFSYSLAYGYIQVQS